MAALTEIYEAIRFPVALSGTRTGVHRVLYNYKNAVLKRRRMQMLASPEYAVGSLRLTDSLGYMLLCHNLT